MLINLTCLIVLFGCIGDAYCWGPAAHLHYAFESLNSLSLYSSTVAAALAQNPMAFFYGCVGADIVLAKKLGNDATHCHRWDNAMKLYDQAPNPKVQAFALGYLSHLAADTISHNCYVPSKTVESFESGVLKHLYWEMRFDQKVTTSKTLRLFQEIAQGSFRECDEHMEQLIPTRLFNFAWNKKIFNRLLIVQSMEQWQRMLTNMGKSEVHALSEEEFEFFKGNATNVVIDFLKNMDTSQAVQNDPIGEVRLRQANALRRHYVVTHKSHPEETKVLAAKVFSAFKSSPEGTIRIEDYQIKI